MSSQEFSEKVTTGAGALIVQPSLPREPATEAALKNHLPLFAPNDELTRVGGLMLYSTDILSVRLALSFRRIVNRILARSPSCWAHGTLDTAIRPILWA